VSVISTAFSQPAARRLQLEPSQYQGPTGIVGVLHDACRRAGIDSAGIWATVPSYLPGASSPKASLALVQRLADLLALQVPTTELEIATASFERQVQELLEGDEETMAYVQQLEERWDTGDEQGIATSIADEVERYLREQ
jgi:predicted ATP-grasp superfamily ATP-dependent carboligase